MLPSTRALEMIIIILHLLFQFVLNQCMVTLISHYHLCEIQHLKIKRWMILCIHHVIVQVLEILVMYFLRPSDVGENRDRGHRMIICEGDEQDESVVGFLVATDHRTIVRWNIERLILLKDNLCLVTWHHCHLQRNHIDHALEIEE